MSVPALLNSLNELGESINCEAYWYPYYNVLFSGTIQGVKPSTLKFIVGSFTKPRMCTFLPSPVLSMAPIKTVQRIRSQNLVCNSQ